MSKDHTYFQKGNPGGPGRPKKPCAKQARKIAEKALCEISIEEALEFRRMVFELAKDGNGAYAKIYYDWLHNPPFVVSGLPKAHTLEEATVLKNKILDSVLDNKMRLAQGDKLMELVEKSVKLDLHKVVQDTQDIDSVMEK